MTEGTKVSNGGKESPDSIGGARLQTRQILPARRAEINEQSGWETNCNLKNPGPQGDEEFCPLHQRKIKKRIGTRSEVSGRGSWMGGRLPPSTGKKVVQLGTGPSHGGCEGSLNKGNENQSNIVMPRRGKDKHVREVSRKWKKWPTLSATRTHHHLT